MCTYGTCFFTLLVLLLFSMHSATHSFTAALCVYEPMRSHGEDTSIACHGYDQHLQWQLTIVTEQLSVFSHEIIQMCAIALT